jgi:hypothetical protein
MPLNWVKFWWCGILVIVLKNVMFGSRLSGQNLACSMENRSEVQVGSRSRVGCNGFP